MSIEYNTNNMINPTEYPVKDDEQFIGKIRTAKIYLIITSIMIIAIPIMLGLLHVIKILSQGDSDMDFINMVAWCIYIFVTMVFIISILSMFQLKKIWHTTAYTTTKRLYIKTTKDGDYVSVNKEDINSISTKLFSMTIELENKEIIKIPTPKAEHQRTLQLLH